MGINPNQISTIDITGLSSSDGSVILSKSNGENIWSSNSKSSLILPVGTEAERDSADLGRIRFNTTSNSLDITLVGPTGGTIWKSASQSSVNGTANLPGISFSLDGNTGFYREANAVPNDKTTNYVGLSINASTVATFSPSRMNLNTELYLPNYEITTKGVKMLSTAANTLGFEITTATTPVTFKYSNTTSTWISNKIIRLTPDVVIPDSDLDAVVTVRYLNSKIGGSIGNATVNSSGLVKLGGLSQITGSSTEHAASSASVNQYVAGEMTSAKVLAKILPVDGSNSGLDADLLDGQHGSYYASAASIVGKVDRAGDTMTGHLSIPVTPTASTHATSKQYVDTKVAATGGTMTGHLTLSGAPTNDLHAATKQYADTKLSKDGGIITGNLQINTAPTQDQHVATKQYVDGKISPSAILTTILASDGFGSGIDADLLDGQQGSYYASVTSVSGKVNKTGDSMTGTLTLTTTGQVVVNPAGSINISNGAGGGALYFSNGTTKGLVYDGANYALQGGQLYVNGGKVWTMLNDGTGSGLDADMLDGLHADSFLTSTNFGSNSKITRGYQVLPNGLIIQWGTDTGAGNKFFPMTFPNQCLTIVAGNSNQQGTFVDNIYAYAISTSQFYSASKSSGSNGITGYAHQWIAIGH